jgi:hypothetical protein
VAGAASIKAREYIFWSTRVSWASLSRCRNKLYRQGLP